MFRRTKLHDDHDSNSFSILFLVKTKFNATAITHNECSFTTLKIHHYLTYLLKSSGRSYLHYNAKLNSNCWNRLWACHASCWAEAVFMLCRLRTDKRFHMITYLCWDFVRLHNKTNYGKTFVSFWMRPFYLISGLCNRPMQSSCTSLRTF